jgi:nitrite reductase (NADH) small subunit
VKRNNPRGLDISHFTFHKSISRITKIMSDWKTICALTDIPQLGSRVVKSAIHGDVAIFRTADDDVFALHDKCPHKQGPLSQGIVHGRQVTCPLHSWKINLDSGEAQAPDIGCTRPFSAKVEDGLVLLRLD